MAHERTDARTEHPSLPVWPDVWYVVARSADIARGGIVDGLIAGRPFVIFRTAHGDLAALDAYCPHMGAHLRNGQVIGEKLRCPLHHWVFDRDGNIRGKDVRLGQRSRAWPVAERFGLVFLFAGRSTAPELPRTEVDGYAWITGDPVALETDWRAMLINGFDLQHMFTVHQRALTAPPQFSRTDQGAMRLEYATRVMPGGGFTSWVTKRVARDQIRVRQTCYGATIVLESNLGSVRSCAVFGFIQQGGKARAYTAFGTIRRGMLWPLRLRITRWFFLSFLRKDFAVIEGMRLVVDGVDDPGVRNVSAYLRSLPDLEAQRADG
jgi:phenylpropionate dioxygenase-like ring-hydroxylating dioxygenase large terminal subunit